MGSVNEHGDGQAGLGAVEAQASTSFATRLMERGIEQMHADLVDDSGYLASLSRRAETSEQAGLAPSTRRNYASDWAQFAAWCELFGLQSLPAEPRTVRLYITELAHQNHADGIPRYRPASIGRHISSIAHRHHHAGYGRGLAHDPAVANVMAGIRRQFGTRPVRRRPLLLDDITTIIAAMDHHRWPDGAAAARDALALWLGFAAALRRSEVSALTIGSIAHHPDEGLHIFVASSKSDQESAGATLGIPTGSTPSTCVPCAYTTWVRVLLARGDRADLMRVVFARGPENGEHACRTTNGRELSPVGVGAALLPDEPLLRPVDKAGRVGDRPLSGSGLNEMLKRRVTAAGIDPQPYGFHSLRAGFVTQARRNGAEPHSVRMQTRHSTDVMVDVYDREYLPLTPRNAVWALGL